MSYFDYPDLPNGRSQTIDYTSKDTLYKYNPSLYDYSECEALRIRHFNPKSKSFADLPDAPELRYLDIDFANCIDLSGIEKFPKLQRLDISYCSGLISLNGIENISSDIYCLWIDHAKNLTDHFKVTALKNIKTLAFNSCGKIDSLAFVNDLPNLKSIFFAYTDVSDGNLTPLICRTPMPEIVSFSDKKHFSHKCKDINEIITEYRI